MYTEKKLAPEPCTLVGTTMCVLSLSERGENEKAELQPNHCNKC